MKQASQNYLIGTIVKTPLKVYFAGSSLHVLLQEIGLLLTFAVQQPQNAEVLSQMVVRAVMIYIPAHSADTLAINCILGMIMAIVWTVRYDRATNF